MTNKTWNLMFCPYEWHTFYFWMLYILGKILQAKPFLEHSDGYFASKHPQYTFKCLVFILLHFIYLLV